MPPELRAMMERYNQLGRLLPKDADDLDLKNPDVRAEVKVVIAEMNRVWAQINAFLAAARKAAAAPAPPEQPLP
jgi:hypothetical protein